ncbi:ABR142Wp [Eremothecium gossypii ATCC 10895]|uniref:ABR142Wp n=1 Tax=Eremothecium gossypii (strain ATCC 10895 / CBS 109.51 / FGSC 9923 / NRRL Y-1056) TaxID=284811 RepID=Q75D82_EREGS|nr:ABR142Wp [Eremothecium gossypii ATCC 10895]AAS50913.2 ABR142Wp [Eremothecium gossypii ATCC 10895]
MSVAYSTDSVSSYMRAMQAMIGSAQEFRFTKRELELPEVEVECVDIASATESEELTTLSLDRNVWDEVFDLFEDLDSRRLETLAENNDQAKAVRVYKKLFQLLDESTLHSSEEEVVKQLVVILKTHGEDGMLEQVLFDCLGSENIELLSYVIQQQAVLKQLPVDEGVDLRQFLMEQPTLLSETDIRAQVLLTAAEGRNQELRKLQRIERYPNIYRNSEVNSSAFSFGGQEYVLPVGTTRLSLHTHEEVVIPCSENKNEYLSSSRLLKVEDLDRFCQSVFPYETLNAIQTLVYPVAYKTNENMLICAPTGAGKTDIALLTILNTVKQFSEINGDEVDIFYEDFKVIYVAPLKALAAEIVDKFSQRLAPYKIRVRELTGDMQLTKAEIIETQVIVTTPEKWDVVTRKANGDNDLVSKVKLLIIDEVHLLHEDRGSVIETLVARTLRQVESSQSMIRILGLSATLPNFFDVADFLGVNRHVGMFYFDQSFRPKPLEQQLLGCRGKAGSKQGRENIDKVSYEKLYEHVLNGSQVMVFVHSRKDTVRTARNYISFAQANQQSDVFLSSDQSVTKFSRDISKHKDRDMKELFQHGFGIHHAGMSRSDRNLTEKMFKEGAINVLICTATLAWGVNLPADVVLIKGTQIYDSKKGGFIDLGISDVIQIFGRAGRPGFGSLHGTGILCTTSDRLDHYISLITQQYPIESKFSSKLVDNLNAEISLGTVTNVEEGITWLGYTYLYVRMKQNPLIYGLDWNEVSNDPQLYDKRRSMIMQAARRLHALQMIVFNDTTMNFIPKDLGRVASDFYLLNESVEIFNQLCNPRVTEADVLAMISMSSEFDSIKYREDEAGELAKLFDTAVECQVGGQVESSAGKTNILLQAYISQTRINDSALISDSNYVAQNSARICRALFLIGINKRWGRFAIIMLDICKAIERRMWAFEHPLSQFALPETILRQLRDKSPPIENMLDMEASELGELVHNNKMGAKLYRILRTFPRVEITAECFPITTNVMRIHATLEPDFIWDFHIHGNAQFFWVLVEESDNSEILHFEKFILSRKQMGHVHEMDFMIPLSDPLPPQVVIKVVSDTWIGSESTHVISFQHLIRPHNETLLTRLLRLRPLPTTALNNPLVESIYQFKYFNPLQTMTFHTLYNTNENVFVGSPTGSGKTVVAELAIWHAFRDFPGSKVVYIAPMKALVRERLHDWKKRITPVTGDRLVELTGDSVPDPRDVKDATIIITTPEKFDGISRNWQTRKFVQNVSLVIMDEIHLLASDRGPILEMIVSRMNYISAQTKKPIRLLGMSTAVANAYDMAGWLGVKNNGLYNFPSSIRPVPLKMYIDGFPDNLAFCPLMKTMNKPAFMAISQHSPDKPVLIFVASRRQTRLTALDLIHLCGMEDNPRRFMKMDDEGELRYYLDQVSDETLKLSLQFGIGLHHAGLVEKDRSISHQLFQLNKIQILVATSTLAWGVNLPAHLVIIKGTQFYDAKIEGYRDMDLTDILQMMGRAGRPAYDTSGTAIVYTKESKKMFYKHFLNVGFPVESSLHKVLDDHIGAEISSGTITTRQEAMDFLTYTFLFRRAHHNPTYYGILEDTTAAGVNEYLSSLIDTTVQNLAQSQCIMTEGKRIIPTAFLSISAYYYISHKTVRQLLSQLYNSCKFQDVLKWLSLAVEYDELPVRGGETIMNVEMSENSRYSVESTFTGEQELPIWDPHVKAFLLLQAYLSRADLAIADYYQDTISVLDQALRILQAYIDIASESGYLRTVMTMIKAMQCIKQGTWYEDNPVTALPGITLQRLDPELFGDDGFPYEYSGEMLTLEKLGRMGYAALCSVCRVHNIQGAAKDKFIREASMLPVLDKVHFKDQSNPDKLTLVAFRHNESYKDGFRVWCDKFPKAQKELWFAIGFQGDELLMIKRCQPRRDEGRVIITCDFVVPEELYGETLGFVLINDAMDLHYELSHTLAGGPKK